VGTSVVLGPLKAGGGLEGRNRAVVFQNPYQRLIVGREQGYQSTGLYKMRRGSEAKTISRGRLSRSSSVRCVGIITAHSGIQVSSEEGFSKEKRPSSCSRTHLLGARVSVTKNRLCLEWCVCVWP
jgi:hypothetical protein